ncbi:MAG: hypothetical protein EAZ95_08215 [Bacteroidetes bacterium]|nr:MAG: hypothetical protein EAZ95_08215 [Bacteroidota bacterium]
MPPLYDKKGTRDNKDAPLKPLVIREISKEKVKCMFYNAFTNKFTEQFFFRRCWCLEKCRQIHILHKFN